LIVLKSLDSLAPLKSSNSAHITTMVSTWSFTNVPISTDKNKVAKISICCVFYLVKTRGRKFFRTSCGHLSYYFSSRWSLRLQRLGPREKRSWGPKSEKLKCRRYKFAYFSVWLEEMCDILLWRFWKWIWSCEHSNKPWWSGVNEKALLANWKILFITFFHVEIGNILSFCVYIYFGFFCMENDEPLFSYNSVVSFYSGKCWTLNLNAIPVRQNNVHSPWRNSPGGQQ
jgi:hypothetical protein